MTLQCVLGTSLISLSRYTGAGKSITDDLLRGNDPPRAFVETMDDILQKAVSPKCRIWIDAEQQVLQPSTDRWTRDLMRKYNRKGEAVLYNTLQAYLKSSREKLKHQLQIAHREGWMLGIKPCSWNLHPIRHSGTHPRYQSADGQVLRQHRARSPKWQCQRRPGAGIPKNVALPRRAQYRQCVQG